MQKKKLEVEKEAKLQPLNVDTLSSDGFSKTILNTQPKRDRNEMSEEERENQMREFVKKNEKEIKEYGMMQKFDDSKKFLMEGRSTLACEETANYLVIWCINLEMEVWLSTISTN